MIEHIFPRCFQRLFGYKIGPTCTLEDRFANLGKQKVTSTSTGKLCLDDECEKFQLLENKNDVFWYTHICI